MKILITGGSGFVGKNAAEILSKKHEILTPRHADLDLVDGISVRDWMNSHEIDAVIHSATKPGHRNAVDLTSIAITNLHMFSNLFESSIRRGVGRFLFLGSGSEFDLRNYRPEMREVSLGDYLPADDTGFSKYVCTRMMQGIPGYVNIRFFGIFGKYEDYAIRFISNAICKAIFDLPITLRQDKVFSYTYVDDGIRAIDRFLTVPIHELFFNDYNVTPNEKINLLGLAELVRSISGKADLPIYVGLPGKGTEYSGSNERFTSLFPDFSFTPIEKSVRMLYNWYASHIELIDRDKLLADK